MDDRSGHPNTAGSRRRLADNNTAEGAAPGPGDETEATEIPLDPASIRISTRQPTIGQVVERMRNDEIHLRPETEHIPDWSTRSKSRFVESLLLHIPLPVFYMAADICDEWWVLDGLQRIATLRDFMVDRTLRLRGLEYFSQFRDHSFDDLPRPMQRRITDTRLCCHVIEPSTSQDVGFNIYTRIHAEGRMRRMLRGAP